MGGSSHLGTGKGTVTGGSGQAGGLQGGAAVYVKDIDGDMTALRGEDGSSFGSASRDIEMPAYQVSVTGGSPRAHSWLEDAAHSPTGGIHTTTVVTQRVDSL